MERFRKNSSWWPQPYQLHGKVTKATELYMKSMELQTFRSPLHHTFQFYNQDGHIVPPFNLTFSHKRQNGNLLAISDESGFVNVINTNHPLFQFHQPSPIYSENSIHQIPFNSDSSIARWDAHSNAIFDIIWSESDEHILTAAGDQLACIWDVETTKLVYCMYGHEMSVKCIRQLPGNPFVYATGSRDGNVHLWDTRIRASIRMFHEQNENYPPNPQDPTNHPSLSRMQQHIGPKGCQMVELGSMGSLVQVHGIPSTFGSKKRKRRKNLMSANPQQSVTCLEFTGHGEQLVTAGAVDGMVKFWDLRKIPIPANVQPLRCFSHVSMPSGRRYGISSMRFDSTRSKLLVSATNSQLYVYNCLDSTTEPHSIYSGHVNGSFYVKSTFSPEGDFIVSGSCDQNLYIWQVALERQISPSACPIPPSFALKGHAGEVSGISWSSNVIASCSDDCTVRIWSPSTSVQSKVYPLCPNFLKDGYTTRLKSLDPALNIERTNSRNTSSQHHPSPNSVIGSISTSDSSSLSSSSSHSFSFPSSSDTTSSTTLFSQERDRTLHDFWS